MIRQVEDGTGVVIFDDTIQEKMWTGRRSDLLALRPLPGAHGQGAQPAQCAVPPQGQVVWRLSWCKSRSMRPGDARVKQEREDEE